MQVPQSPVRFYVFRHWSSLRFSGDAEKFRKNAAAECTKLETDRLRSHCAEPFTQPAVCPA
jgi:hypothetical protein